MGGVFRARKEGFTVRLEDRLRPRLERVQLKYNLNQAEAVELALNLACVSSDGILTRIFSVGEGKRDGVMSLSQVMRQMNFMGGRS